MICSRLTPLTRCVSRVRIQIFRNHSALWTGLTVCRPHYPPMQGDTVLAYRIITIRVLWIREFDKFIFCVCHTRKTVQASGSPMFFLLLKRPPTLGDNTDGVWAALAGAASELARRRADRCTSEFCVAPRTWSRVRGHGSGPSVSCRPFSEPSSTAGAASELARRRADRDTTDFCVAPRTSSRTCLLYTSPSPRD